MHHFFTTESTAPPAISALWYSVMVLLIVTAIMMSLRYYQNEQFRKCFQYLQGFQCADEQTLSESPRAAQEVVTTGMY